MLKLTMETDNSAFDGDGVYSEAARILREVALAIDNGKRDGVLRDCNGNKVGEFTLTIDPDYQG